MFVGRGPNGLTGVPSLSLFFMESSARAKQQRDVSTTSLKTRENTTISLPTQIMSRFSIQCLPEWMICRIWYPPVFQLALYPLHSFACMHRCCGDSSCKCNVGARRGSSGLLSSSRKERPRGMPSGDNYVWRLLGALFKYFRWKLILH